MTQTAHNEPRRRGRRYISLLLTVALMAANVPRGLADSMDESAAATAVEPAAPTPTQLQQLVAPIALYPDELIAQILAAATFPEQVVEADRWVQQHGASHGQQLAQDVDAQPWDASVKGLTAFPSVLANMDKNLPWTSALGDAYVNHQDVMDAIQVMRRRAREAGALQTTAQQNVADQGSHIVIEPANPEVIYVPQYDPWLIYGPPVVAWPGWYAYPGLYLAEPGIVFGVGFDVGLFAGFGWGWHHWGFDWDRRRVVHDHEAYVSNSRTFIDRRPFDRVRAGDFRGDGFRGAGGVGGEQHTPAAPRGAPGGGFGGGFHGGHR